MVFSWIQNLIRRPSRAARRVSQSGVRKERSSFRPSLEYLEARVVPAFLAPVSAAAGVTVNSMAIGDFNGDGKADIVAVGTISGRGVISVSLGNGDGTFQSAIVSNSGNSNPLQVRVGDFDGDGKLDVVCLGSYYIDSLTVCKGNGDGTFGVPTPYTYSIPPTEIEVADMNGDGKLDLIEGNHFFSTTSVQMNDGTGHFGAKVDSAGVLSPTNVEAADFNGDGKADLVSTSASYYYSGGVNVQLGNGNGSLQAPHSHASGGSPVDEVIGDFNGDGKFDIAVANSTSVGILLGNGDGTFAAPTTYAVGSTVLDISKGDFNGDGISDLVERTGTGFAVELGIGDGTFQSATQVAAGPGSNLLAADFNNDGVTDVAIAGGSAINVSMNDSTPINGTTNGAVNFVLSAPTTTVAGAPVPVTVSVVDASGALLTDYTGLVRVFSNDPRGTSVSYTFTANDAGTHTFAGLDLYTAGTRSILVSAPLVGTIGQTISVTPAAATHFALTTPASTVAGAPMTFSVVALDAWNNMGATYTGTVHFGTSDAQGTVPADYTFLDADAGIHAFTGSLATMNPAGQTITATDTLDATVTGKSSAVAVTPTTAVSLTLTGGGGRIGSPHTVTVQARDVFGNATNLYNGTIHLTASDPALGLPATDATMVNGVATATVTPMTMGTQTLTATAVGDPTVSGGTETIVGTAGAAVRFAETAIPATTAGVAQSFTVTAYDAFGNVSADYTGTVYFTSSDSQAVLPYYYTFTLGDAGVHTFSATLRTAGTQSVTITDWSNASLSATQTGIGVTAAAAVSFLVTPLHGVVAGTGQSFTVTAYDAFGNLASSYRGTLNFTSSDTIAVLPAKYTFTAADAGTHTFSMTFKTSTGQTFTVSDAATGSILASQRDIMNSAAAMTGFAFRAPSNATAGVAFSVVLSAVDAFGNVITGYVGKVHFSGPAGVPVDYTFTAADAGSHTFSITLGATGTLTIGVQDTVSGGLRGSTSIVVKAGTTTGGTATGGGTGGGKKP